MVVLLSAVLVILGGYTLVSGILMVLASLLSLLTGDD
jgi:hypothetical protein